MDILRVGAVPYLNGLPLVEWFREPTCAASVELTVAVPSRLGALLEMGALDVALLSSIEAFRRSDVAVVDGVSISADGPVRSVRILSNVPPSEIVTMAVDEGSLTSVALGRIVLDALWGARPTIQPAVPDVAAMLSQRDAALVIGDTALRPYEAAYGVDLGEAWKELTGLPFVYALWIARDRSTALAARPLLLAAKEWGLQRLSEIARSWAGRTHMAPNLAEDYLTNVIHYDLAEREKTAIARFADLCCAHGVLAMAYPVTYCSEE